MGVALDIQAAFFNKLDGTAGVTTLLADHAYTVGKKAIYDDVPQANDAGSAVAFPYVALGDTVEVQWDTDDSVGRETVQAVHTFSRYKGKKELKNIMDAIKAALHQASLAVSGQVVILVHWENTDSFLEPDGVTRHGVQRFRIITEGA